MLEGECAKKDRQIKAHAKDYNALETAHNELQDKVYGIKEAKTKAEEAKRVADEYCTRKSREYTILQTELKTAQEDARKLNQGMSKMKESLSMHEKVCKDQQARIKSINEEKSKLEEAKRLAEDECMRKGHEVTSRESLLQGERASKERVERQLNEERTKKNDEIAVRQKEISTLSEELRLNKEDLQKSNQALVQANQTLEKKEKNMKEQLKDKRLADERCAQKDKELVAQEHQYSELSAELKSKKEDLSKSSLAHNQANEALQMKEKTLQEQLQAITKHEEDLSAQRSSQKELEGKLRQVQDKYKKSEAHASSVEQQLEQLHRKNEKLESDLAAKVTDVRLERKKVSDLKKEEKLLNEALRIQQKATDKRNKAYNKLEQQIRGLENDTIRLGKDFGDLRSEAQRLANQIIANPASDHTAIAANFIHNVLREDRHYDEEQSSGRRASEPIIQTATTMPGDRRTTNIGASTADPFLEDGTVGITDAKSRGLDSGPVFEFGDKSPDRTLRQQLGSASPSMVAHSPAGSVQFPDYPDYMYGQAVLPISITRLRIKSGLSREMDDEEKLWREKLEKLDFQMKKEYGRENGLPKLSKPNELMWDPEYDSAIETEKAAAEQPLNSGSSPQNKFTDKYVDGATQTDPAVDSHEASRDYEDGLTKSDDASISEASETSNTSDATKPPFRLIARSALLIAILIALFLASLFNFLCSRSDSLERSDDLLGRGDDSTRLALLSMRAGGGTGTAIPRWLWDDVFLDYISGLYG